MIDSEIIRNSVAIYGEENQTTVCMEELAELIQAISKEKRGLHDKKHLAEEIADVEICLEMLKVIYEIDEDMVENQINRKQERQVRRNKQRLGERDREVYSNAIDDAKSVILQTLDNEILVDTLHLRLEQLKEGVSIGTNNQ